MQSELPVAYLSYDDLRAIADRFLHKYHPDRSASTPIEEIIDLRFKVDIIPTPGLHLNFGIDAFITSDFSAIYVEEFVYQSRINRYRFSLAHEFSHVVLHQQVFESLSFSTIDEWISAIPNIPERQYQWIEWQANALAGLILVPEEPLASSFKRAVAKADRAGLSLAKATDAARAAVAGYVARDFDVSAQVVERRIEKDGLWDGI